MIHIRPLAFTVSLLGLVACHGDALAPEPAETRAVPAISALANSWSTKPPLSTGRAGLVAATVDGTVYVIGGDPDGWGGHAATLRTVEAYSKAANAWSSRTPLPSSRAYSHGAAVIKGKIYVVGGLYQPPPVIGKPSLDPIPTKTLYVYDPVKNAWSRKADMPIAAYGGVSAGINGKLYVALTGSEPGKVGTSLYRYDPLSDSWSQRASTPHIHHFGAASAINGKLYVAGGWANKTEFADLDVYDPASDSWSTKAPLPTARYGTAGRALDGKFYVAGGISADGDYNRLDVYDPATNSWASRPDLPTSRWTPAAAVAGGAVYIIGGGNPRGSAVTEAYTP